MKERLTLEERARLVKELYTQVFGATESFRWGYIGADMMYLVGAILDDDYTVDCVVDWSKEVMDKPPPLYQVLTQQFPRDHKIWDFIVI